MNPGTELAIPVRSSLDGVALIELAEIFRSGERVEIVDDPDAISREIFEQILGADSDAALNQMGQATGWRELEGVQILLGPSFRWRPSSYDEGAAVFLIVPADRINEDGTLEPVVLTTGSRNVIAQLMNMASRNTIEGRIVSLERSEKASARGFFPLWLRVHNPTPADTAAAPEGEPADSDAAA